MRKRVISWASESWGRVSAVQFSVGVVMLCLVLLAPKGVLFLD